MQLIDTTEWTEVTGLTEGNTYVVQASVEGRGKRDLVQCYWTQTKPDFGDTCCGEIGTGVKITYSNGLYVKTNVVPVYINAEEVN